jgi:hypothetical protein
MPLPPLILDGNGTLLPKNGRRQAMKDSITLVYGCYKHRSSATRAMRKMVGDQISVSFPGISNRFETTAILRPDMLKVGPNGAAWSVRATITESDVLCVIKGEDGYPKNVPYAEVAHWQDACTPLCKTPRGTFSYRFRHLKEAAENGFELWFMYEGMAVVADKNFACVVRTPYAA